MTANAADPAPRHQTPEAETPLNLRALLGNQEGIAFPAVDGTQMHAVAVAPTATGMTTRKLDEADAAVLRLTAQGTRSGLAAMHADRGVSTNRMAALKEAIDATTGTIEQNVRDDAEARTQADKQEQELIDLNERLKSGMRRIAQVNVETRAG